MINQEEYELLKGLDDKWKWIARDKDGVLGVYDAKVVKTKFHNFWIMAIKKKIDLTLFQFIHWEDEEPYRISDLIKEYEIKGLRLAPSGTVIVDAFSGSEETEVKKDLKEAILGIEVTQFDGQKADLEELVNPKQLEKVISDWMPEVLSQELPVIPKYVAEWMEENSTGRCAWWKKIAEWEGEVPAEDRKVYDWYTQYNEDTFIIAWITSHYEIEEEPKYLVLDTEYTPMLVKSYGAVNRAYTHLSIHEKGRSTEDYQLTEQEIKEYDERFWPFAVPVEGVEE